MSAADAEGLVRSGVEALRRGDPRTAKSRFEQIVEQGGDAPWLALAQACNMLGDAAGEESALQRALAADPRNLPAMLAMGELHARQRNRRSASAFFRSALKLAAMTPQIPAHVRPLLDRAQAFARESQAEFEAHLEGRLAAAGVTHGSVSPRVAQALDLLLGRKPLYVQQPNMFYFPELPQRPFFDRGEFDWVEPIEARVPELQAELAELLADEASFPPAVVQIADAPPSTNPLLNNPSWGAFHIWLRGRLIEENAARVPAMMAALELAPIPMIPNSAPMVMLSRLKPGTHIVAHHGVSNTRLICHLPLVVPEGCGLRVGNQVRAWEEGKALIFDDSFEHEAWNRGTGSRVVLLFEIWRPEINAAERAELTALFAAVELLGEEEA